MKNYDLGNPSWWQKGPMQASRITGPTRVPIHFNFAMLTKLEIFYGVFNDFGSKVSKIRDLGMRIVPNVEETSWKNSKRSGKSIIFSRNSL